MGDLIGLQTREIEVPEAKVITPADFTNSGILIISERGRDDSPQRVSSMTQARARFGNPRNGEHGLLAVRELFTDAAPFSLNLYIQRMLGSGATAAAASALSVGQLVFKSILKDEGDPAPVWVTIVAGTNEGVKITLEDAATEPTVTEIYDNITAENLVEEINYGIGSGTGQSTLIRVEIACGIIPTVMAQTSMVEGADGEYRHTFALTGTQPVLTAGQRGYADKGAWANKYAFKFFGDVNNPNERIFQMYQLVKGQYVTVGNPIRGLTAENWVAKMNDAGSGSMYVYVSTAGTLPNVSTDYHRLTSGTDGTALTPAQIIAYRVKFDTLKISYLLALDCYGTPDVVVDIAQTYDVYCETVKKRTLALMSVPYGYTIANLESTVSTTSGLVWKDLLRPKSWLAAYSGWVSVDDERDGLPTGTKVAIPGVSKVLGAGFIRKTFNDPSKLPSVAPAGYGAVMRGISAIDIQGYNETDLEYLVHTLGINPIMLVEGVGYIPRTSRTMSTINKHYDIHKRRSLHYLGDTFQANLGWIEQEAHVPDTWKILLQSLDLFLQPHYNKGMFDKTLSYEEAVILKCDTDNNSEEDQLERRLHCLVGVKFVNIIETAYLDIASIDRKLTITEL